MSFPGVHELLTAGRSSSDRHSPSPKGSDTMTTQDQIGRDDLDQVDGTVDDDDLGISAQARAMPDLDRMLDQLARRSPRPIGALLDVGCGMGALTGRIGRRLGIKRLIGI